MIECELRNDIKNNNTTGYASGVIILHEVAILKRGVKTIIPLANTCFLVIDSSSADA